MYWLIPWLHCQWINDMMINGHISFTVYLALQKSNKDNSVTNTSISLYRYIHTYLQKQCRKIHLKLMDCTECEVVWCDATNEKEIIVDFYKILWNCIKKKVRTKNINIKSSMFVHVQQAFPSSYQINKQMLLFGNHHLLHQIPLNAACAWCMASTSRFIPSAPFIRALLAIDGFSLASYSTSSNEWESFVLINGGSLRPGSKERQCNCVISSYSWMGTIKQ